MFEKTQKTSCIIKAIFCLFYTDTIQMNEFLIHNFCYTLAKAQLEEGVLLLSLSFPLKVARWIIDSHILESAKLYLFFAC